MKIIRNLILLFVIFFSFNAVSFAYSPKPLLPSAPLGGVSIKYCLISIGDNGCEKLASGLEDYLNRVPGNWSKRSNFLAENGMISFSDFHFQYYIPVYVIEDRIYEALVKKGDYYGTYLDATEWMIFDKDRNLIPDDLDEVLELFPSVYTDYFDGDYEFEFKKLTSSKFPIQLDYTIISGANGQYTSDDVLYVDPCLDLLYCYNVSSKRSLTDIKSTFAHELFHAIQHAYIGDSIWEFNSDPHNNGYQFLESLAVVMESKIVYWGVDFLQYLSNAPYLNPNRSIFGLSDDVFDRYGAFVWYTFLYENYGSGIVLDLLTEYSGAFDLNSPDERTYVAIDNALKKRGITVQDAYLEYVKWNYDNEFYQDGKHFNLPKITKVHNSFPIKDVVIDSTMAPHYFGSNYVEFVLGPWQSALEVDFNGNADADMYVSFLSADERGLGLYDNDVNYLVKKGESKKLYLPNPDAKYEKFVMIVSVVGINSYLYNPFDDYVYPYSYSAKKIENDEVPVDGNSSVSGGGGGGEVFSDSLFTDVLNDNKNYNAIKYLQEAGIIKGYSDGTFKPAKKINRAELLKILVEGQGVTPSLSDYKNCFPDVLEDWYAPYVCYAKTSGWVSGYPNGNFKPSNFVNKVEALKMLLNSKSVSVPQAIDSKPFDDVAIDDWFASFVFKAKELEILEEVGSSYSPASDMTRAGISENLYRLLLNFKG